MIPQGAEAQREELVPQVIVLDVRSSFMKNYNYVVVDPISRRAVVIDPAWEMEKIERALGDAGATLSGVLITHSHADHIHLARPLAEKYECPIWMSNEEISASGYRSGRLIGVDTQAWLVGEMLIEPMFTPGHTPGCFCYLIGDNLFTGDVLFAESCGGCPDTQAAHAMFSSLENLKLRLKPHTRIFPGHSFGKPPGQIMAELVRENVYLQFSDRESFATYRMRSGKAKASGFV